MTLNMLRFLRFEGKAGLDGNEKPISKFEYDLYNDIHSKLEKSSLTMEEKVMIWFVLSEIDSYDGRYFKVVNNMKKLFKEN